jgi:AraC-like DNA-binding protein
VGAPLAWYREFVPCPALRDDVYAFFSFVPGPPSAPSRHRLLRSIPFEAPTFCSPQFADGHVSLAFELGHNCGADGRWSVDSNALRGTVIGPMTHVGRTTGSDRPEMAGIYFRPGRVASFLQVAIADLTDRTVDLGDLWGARGARLASELCELSEEGRIDRLEAILLARVETRERRAGSVDVDRLAAAVVRRRGLVSVEAMASGAGASRQHLTRQFREQIGVGPKLYSRLARFQSGLSYAGCRSLVDWAQAAAEMGYADQSHLTAEFRQFSGLTPRTLAQRDWFHPFIERARGRRAAS